MKFIPESKYKLNDTASRCIGQEGEDLVSFRLKRYLQRDPNSRFISNLIIVDNKGNSHQIDHIMICTNGVFCIETKNWVGGIYGNEYSKTWTQINDDGRNTLINPVIQNKGHCEQIDKIIGPKYFCNSLIVMAKQNADTIKIPYVINDAHLRNYLQRFNNGVHLSKEEIDEIYDLISSHNSDLTLQEHIENIKR